MKEIAADLLLTMATNRKRHKGCWDKLRIDRIEKLVPEGTDTGELLSFLVENDWVKLTNKRDDNGKLISAVQLRYKKFRAAIQ